VSSVTYAGQPLNRTSAITHTTGKPRVEVWNLTNPPTGTSNVNVTLAAADKTAIGAVSYTGVDQNTPISGVNTSQGTSNSMSVSGSMGNYKSNLKKADRAKYH
jgi:hypothetical protein